MDNIKLKQILNRFYGKMALHNYIYADTDSILVEGCDYCRNAITCEELSHDNDLSYKPCGVTDEKTRMYFRTGGKRYTEIIVELVTYDGIDRVAHFFPNYCPFCGRPLFENMKQGVKENA